MGRKVGKPTSAFLRKLEAAVGAELREEMQTALQVGVLTALEIKSPEARRRLDISAAEYRRAMALVRRATERMAAE